MDEARRYLRKTFASAFPYTPGAGIDVDRMLPGLMLQIAEVAPDRTQIRACLMKILQDLYFMSEAHAARFVDGFLPELMGLLPDGRGDAQQRTAD